MGGLVSCIDSHSSLSDQCCSLVVQPVGLLSACWSASTDAAYRPIDTDAAYRPIDIDAAYRPIDAAYRPIDADAASD